MGTYLGVLEDLIRQSWSRRYGEKLRLLSNCSRVGFYGVLQVKLPFDAPVSWGVSWSLRFIQDTSSFLPRKFGSQGPRPRTGNFLAI